MAKHSTYGKASKSIIISWIYPIVKPRVKRRNQGEGNTLTDIITDDLELHNTTMQHVLQTPNELSHEA
jgi:hypothetical protein